MYYIYIYIYIKIQIDVDRFLFFGDHSSLYYKQNKKALKPTQFKNWSNSIFMKEKNYNWLNQVEIDPRQKGDDIVTEKFINKYYGM